MESTATPNWKPTEFPWCTKVHGIIHIRYERRTNTITSTLFVGHDIRIINNIITVIISQLYLFADLKHPSELYFTFHFSQYFLCRWHTTHTYTCKHTRKNVRLIRNYGHVNENTQFTYYYRAYFAQLTQIINSKYRMHQECWQFYMNQ